MHSVVMLRDLRMRHVPSRARTHIVYCFCRSVRLVGICVFGNKPSAVVMSLWFFRTHEGRTFAVREGGQSRCQARRGGGRCQSRLSVVSLSAYRVGLPPHTVGCPFVDAQAVARRPSNARWQASLRRPALLPSPRGRGQSPEQVAFCFLLSRLSVL